VVVIARALPFAFAFIPFGERARSEHSAGPVVEFKKNLPAAQKKPAEQ